VAWSMYPLIVLAGFLAGFVNTLAGSGSAVSLTLLTFLNVPIDVANGTNRVAILLQNLVAVHGFNRDGRIDWQVAVRLALPACLGSIVGALIATAVDEASLRMAVGVVMLCVLASLFIGPKRWLEGQARSIAERTGWGQLLLYFGVGVYGGCIQVGVGVLLLVSLVLCSGYDLVRGNGVKVLIILCFTVFALAVFVCRGKVDWGIGATLALGNMAGAAVATRQAARRGAGFVRVLLITVVAAAALRYLGVWAVLVRLLPSG